MLTRLATLAVAGTCGAAGGMNWSSDAVFVVALVCPQNTTVSPFRAAYSAPRSPSTPRHNVCATGRSTCRAGRGEGLWSSGAGWHCSQLYKSNASAQAKRGRAELNEVSICEIQHLRIHDIW